MRGRRSSCERVALAAATVAAVAAPLFAGPAATSGVTAVGMVVAGGLNASAARRLGGPWRWGAGALAVSCGLWAVAHGSEASGLLLSSPVVTFTSLLGWLFTVAGLLAFRRGVDLVSLAKRDGRPVWVEMLLLLTVVLFAIWQIVLVPFQSGHGAAELALVLSSVAVSTTISLVTTLPFALYARSHPLARWTVPASVVAVAGDVAFTTAALAADRVDYRVFSGVFAVAMLLLTQATCDPALTLPVTSGPPLLDRFRIRVLVAAVAAVPAVSAVSVLLRFDVEPRGVVLASSVVAFGLAVRLRDVLAHVDEATASLSREAGSDALTGLPNRRGLSAQYREQTGPVSVLFVDLDGFKAVNDDLGHATGDRLLQLVAHRLRASVRAGDVVGRLGGDEFVVIGHYRRFDAGELGERLISALCVPFDVDGVQVRIGASVGLAEQAAHEEIESTIARADGAMYVAKRAGKGRLVHVD